MSEKPILFNTEMVRAILDGRKTQTRRIIKPQPKSCLSYICLGTHAGKWNYAPEGATTISGWPKKYSLASVPKRERENLWTPPYHAEDVLYVRETWLQLPSGVYEHRADFPEYSMWYSNKIRKWHPSIHMPKEAARIWLKVKKVRVESLWDISEKDADAEGFGVPIDNISANHSRDAFRLTWVKCYGELSWCSNPWVWVIEFERMAGK